MIGGSICASPTRRFLTYHLDRHAKSGKMRLIKKRNRNDTDRTRIHFSGLKDKARVTFVNGLVVRQRSAKTKPGTEDVARGENASN